MICKIALGNVIIRLNRDFVQEKTVNEWLLWEKLFWQAPWPVSKQSYRPCSFDPRVSDGDNGIYIDNELIIYGNVFFHLDIIKRLLIKHIWQISNTYPVLFTFDNIISYCNSNRLTIVY